MEEHHHRHHSSSASHSHHGDNVGNLHHNSASPYHPTTTTPPHPHASETILAGYSSSPTHARSPDIPGSEFPNGHENQMDHMHHHHHLNGHHHGDDPDPSSSHLDPSTSRSGGHMAHGGMGHMMMGHMNKPVFQWVTDVPVLFEHWTTSTAIELAAAMLMAAFLAAAYEWLRNWLSVWDGTRHRFSEMSRWKRMCVRIMRAFAHALTATVGYLQMLFAMTYDLRIFIAIILGCGLGFFILGPYFRKVRQRRKNTQRACARRKGGYVLDGRGDEYGQRLMPEAGEKDCDEEREKGECSGDATEVGGNSLLPGPCGEDRETVL